MIKWILYAIFFVLAGAFLGLFYLQYPGRIIIIWLGYEIEFSILTGIVLLFMLIFATLIFIRILYFIRSILCSFLSFFQKSKAQKEKSEVVQ